MAIKINRMLSFYNKYAGNIKFSQNGEEKLLIEILKRLKIETGNCIEIGGNDGRWLSNTALLIENGWAGSFIEADYDLWEQCCKNWQGNASVKSVCSMVSEANINAFVDADCDVLSIDTDGIDYQILQAMEAKPKIVIIEIDSSIPPDEERFNSEGGAGYLPMVKLGISKGYFLLCHTGNLVLVDKQYKKLFPEIKGDGLKNADEYFKRDWLQVIA
jgi:hypothetical protein